MTIMSRELTVARPAEVEITDEITDLNHLNPQVNARTTPIYRVNPWHPWVLRAGGFAGGTVLAALVTAFASPHMLGWAVATTIAAALLYAFVLGGYELREQHPIFTDVKP